MLGVDTSKDTLDSTLCLSATQQKEWHLKVPNDPVGIQILLDKTDPAIPWVVEPTGRYSSLVVKQVTEAGRIVLLAPNRAAKLFLKSQNSRAKTDKIDSFGLARFGLSRPLQTFELKSELVEELDQLLSARKGLTGSLTRLKLQSAELAYAGAILNPAIEVLETQIREVDKKIQNLVKSHAELDLVSALRTIPGIGPVTAAAIASRLLSKEFASPDAFVAYVGLDVAVRQSGTSIGKVKLTKQGDAELRRLLYMAAMANSRCKESVFKDRYHLLRSQGRSAVAAFNIVARKIAHICWALRHHGGTFDPTKVYRQSEQKDNSGQKDSIKPQERE